MKLRTAFVRVAAVAAVGLAAGLGACTTPNYDQQFAMINQRFDSVDTRLVSLDARVAEAINRADAAGQAANAAAAEARTANQRIDQLQAMPPMVPRSPRG